MDSEEAKHLREAQHRGRPETDEGPYYHDTWWESYKGGIKGVLGGLFVGAGVGAFIGAAVASALILVAGAAVTPGVFGLITLGFMAFGAMHGAHEFSNVGTVTGAVAAAHEKAEERIKQFETAKFAELKHDLQDLKATVTGDSATQLRDAPKSKEELNCDEVEALQADYRTTHCDDHCERPRRFMFFKVASIGLAVGATFGAMFGMAGTFTEFLHPVTGALGLADGGLVAASAIVGGGVGASFGINRDLFREIFDVTDHWFRGIVSPSMHQGHANAQEKTREPAREHDMRVFIENAPEQAAMPTYFRDRVNAETARKALLSMDHTTAIRH